MMLLSSLIGYDDSGPTATVIDTVFLGYIPVVLTGLISAITIAVGFLVLTKKL